jgi:hypothetical protein
VNITGETTIVSFYANKEKIYEFLIPISKSASNFKTQKYSTDYFATLPVYNWNAQTITVEGDVPSSFLDAIAQSDELPTKPNNRPEHNFTPVSGWINDPNGLVFKDGIYHLYFQHNPFHVEWGNMSWGHAISEDLLHWKQLEDVMFPDEDGTIFSGCAIINERGLLGLPEDALIFFYTCAGGTSNWSKEKKFVQKICGFLGGFVVKLSRGRRPYFWRAPKSIRFPFYTPILRRNTPWQRKTAVARLLSVPPHRNRP